MTFSSDALDMSPPVSTDSDLLPEIMKASSSRPPSALRLARTKISRPATAKLTVEDSISAPDTYEVEQRSAVTYATLNQRRCISLQPLKLSVTDNLLLEATSAQLGDDFAVTEDELITYLIGREAHQYEEVDVPEAIQNLVVLKHTLHTLCTSDQQNDLLATVLAPGAELNTDDLKYLLLNCQGIDELLFHLQQLIVETQYKRQAIELLHHMEMPLHYVQQHHLILPSIASLVVTVQFIHKQWLIQCQHIVQLIDHYQLIPALRIPMSEWQQLPMYQASNIRTVMMHQMMPLILLIFKYQNVQCTSLDELVERIQHIADSSIGQYIIPPLSEPQQQKQPSASESRLLVTPLVGSQITPEQLNHWLTLLGSDIKHLEHVLRVMHLQYHDQWMTPKDEQQQVTDVYTDVQTFITLIDNAINECLVQIEQCHTLAVEHYASLAESQFSVTHMFDIYWSLPQPEQTLFHMTQTVQRMHPTPVVNNATELQTVLQRVTKQHAEQCHTMHNYIADHKILSSLFSSQALPLSYPLCELMLLTTGVSTHIFSYLQQWLHHGRLMQWSCIELDDWIEMLRDEHTRALDAIRMEVHPIAAAYSLTLAAGDIERLYCIALTGTTTATTTKYPLQRQLQALLYTIHVYAAQMRQHKSEISTVTELLDELSALHTKINDSQHSVMNHLLSDSSHLLNVAPTDAGAQTAVKNAGIVDYLHQRGVAVWYEEAGLLFETLPTLWALELQQPVKYYTSLDALSADLKLAFKRRQREMGGVGRLLSPRRSVVVAQAQPSQFKKSQVLDETQADNAEQSNAASNVEPTIAAVTHQRQRSKTSPSEPPKRSRMTSGSRFSSSSNMDDIVEGLSMDDEDDGVPVGSVVGMTDGEPVYLVRKASASANSVRPATSQHAVG